MRQPTEAVLGPELVINPSAATDTSGWAAGSAAGPVTLTRLVDVQPAVAFRRAGGTGTWAMATAALQNAHFQVGRTYRIQAWMRAGRPGQTAGLTLADGNFRNRPTEVSAHASLTGSWQLVRRTFVATSAGAADTALYLALPAEGPIDVQVTGASVQEVAVPAPQRTDAAPETVTFGGAAGSAPDPAVWNHETGGHGWGNDEVQMYTADTGNAHLDGQGRLNLVARRETARGPDGITRDFTSARLSTQDKLSIPAGSYLEATIQAPTGEGLWPAFWLVGTNIDTVGWPACGELDVLEGWGADPSVAHAAVHLASAADPRADMPYGWGEAGGSTTLEQPLDARAHRFGVYFDQNLVRFYIDREPTMTVWALDALIGGRSWPFASPMYAVLNVAVSVEATAAGTTFPRTMSVNDIAVWRGGLPF